MTGLFYYVFSINYPILYDYIKENELYSTRYADQRKLSQCKK